LIRKKLLNKVAYSMNIDKRILNILVIIVFTIITFAGAFRIFHQPFLWDLVFTVIILRILASYLIYNDYSLAWSKSTGKSYLIKSVVYISAFIVYVPFFYGEVRLALLAGEFFAYMFLISFSMYAYGYLTSRVSKLKSVAIYGAGSAGIKIADELKASEYKVLYFIDDDTSLQKRSIDGKKILSRDQFKTICKDKKLDLLMIAVPSAKSESIKDIYEELHDFAKILKVLPSLENILQDKPISNQLKDVEVEDLLARHPKGLDKSKISEFIDGKIVMITGAGGSIGSEICRQCLKYGASKLILVEHSEYNLYAIEHELVSLMQSELEVQIIPKMLNVKDKDSLDEVFAKYKPDIVVHAAAYKHVPMVEENISSGILNNIIGTKTCIDLAVKYEVEKFVLISTDKAVRPTNVMGTTKRICELYAQNKNSTKTEIVAVRFGNVLGSSGSVIPKFKEQIKNGQNITVTHPDITRYFMLIPEACELVLQAGSLGNGGEIFILDMGTPVKIVDLAQKLIDLSGAENIKIEFSGLRPGEKLYEELLIDDTDCSTQYDGITVARPTKYDIDILNADIDELVACVDDKSRLRKLKDIVPEFEHRLN
jgi:FlaA1/EpsC-like NDP-sugar epimerase